MRHVPRQRKWLYLWIDFERLRPIRPVQEVRIVTNSTVGVFRAIVILPSRLHVAVVHRLLRQTSTGSGSWAQAMNLRLRIMPGSRASGGYEHGIADRTRPQWLLLERFS